MRHAQHIRYVIVYYSILYYSVAYNISYYNILSNRIHGHARARVRADVRTCIEVWHACVWRCMRAHAGACLCMRVHACACVCMRVHACGCTEAKARLLMQVVPVPAAFSAKSLARRVLEQGGGRMWPALGKALGLRHQVVFGKCSVAAVNVRKCGGLAVSAVCARGSLEDSSLVRTRQR